MIMVQGDFPPIVQLIIGSLGTGAGIGALCYAYWKATRVDKDRGPIDRRRAHRPRQRDRSKAHLLNRDW